ncbi:MAG: chromosomal replication initiator protein DnaA, partial [Campylobacter concisus]|nr:chromosomal replication initiator protein DnaA [Campylobacter concisus]
MLADEILENLSNQISPEEYQSYIKQLKFNEKASNEDFIVFNATSELMAKFIKTRYAEKIAYLYEVKTGKKPEV